MKPDLNNLDDLIRRQFNTPDTPGGDWDVPSDKVWKGISAHLGKRPGRRAIWWLFPLGFVLFSLVVPFVIGRTDAVQKPAAPESELDAASGQEDRLTAGSLSEPLNSEEIQEGYSTSSNDHIAPQKEAGPDALNVVDDRDAVEVLNTGKKSREQTASAALIEGTSTSGASGVVPVDAKQSATESVGRSKSTPKESAAKLSDPASAEVRSDHVDEEIIHSRLNNEVSPVARPGDFELLPLPAVIRPLAWTRDIGYGLPDSPELIAVYRDCDPLWSVSGFIAPSWGTRRIVVPNNQPGVRRELLLKNERAVAQVGFGLSLSRSLHPRWSVSGGIEYNSYVIENSARHQVRFTRFGERLNDRGNLENTLDLDLNTSYGDLSTGIVIERSSTSVIDEHRFINIDLVARQSMSVVQVPVSLKYHIPLGSWSGLVHAGLSANLRADDHFEVRLLRPAQTDILNARLSDRTRLAGARKMSLGYQFGVGVEKAINCHWAFSVEPTLSGYLQPVFRTEAVKVYPAQFDLHIGIQYKW